MRDGKSAKDKDYSLRDWFKGGGWKQTGGKYDGKPCARQPGQTTKPYCRDADDRAAMSKDERNKRAAKKRAEDPNPDRTGKAKIVTQEEIILEKEGKKDACYNKVKSRYSVWPSAYASGALVKCRKVGAANWGNKTEEKDHEYSMARSEISQVVSAAKRLKKKMGKGEGNLQAWVQSKITKAADYIDTAADYMDSGEQKESVDIQTADGRTFVQFIDLIKPEPMKGVQIDELKCWKGYRRKGGSVPGAPGSCVKEEQLDEIHSSAHAPHEVPSGDIKKLVKKAVKRIDTDVDGDTDHNDKAKGELGEFIPGVNNKRLYSSTRTKTAKESFSNWREELGEDWQAVNKKDKTDGMSPAAVKAYRRENPGSKLKTAVTGDPKPGSKDAKRRKSFCSRSKGQQDMHNIDCSADPDKAICKARRRWKC